MITEEIKTAFESVNPSTGYFSIRSSVAERSKWQTLFKFYNDNHEKKLGYGCAPCFGKVYFFVKQQIVKQDDNSIR